MDSLPALPPTGGGPSGPSYGTMMGPQEAPDTGAGAGLSQTGGAAMRLAMELDASMKLLAQMVPALAPWAENATMELRMQMGKALTQGGVPTGPEPPANDSFPDGRGRL